MSGNDTSDRGDVSRKGHSKRMGASVLAAAVSLLGTSLHVSAVTSDESPSLAANTESTGQNAIETDPGKKKYMWQKVAAKQGPLKGNVLINNQIKDSPTKIAPQVKVRPPAPPPPPHIK
jgi:hypothetical protein